VNVDDVLSGTGTSTVAALRDWSISALMDDGPGDPSTVFRQPSWNFISGMLAIGMTFPLAPRILSTGVATPITLQGGGSAYLRFAVPDNQEALLQVTGPGGTTISSAIRLTVARIK